MDLTLAAILTAGGAVAAAGLIKGLISLLKTLPGVGDALQTAAGAQISAFLLSAALVVVAAVDAVSSGVVTADLTFYFACFLAWYGVARLSMGIHDDLSQNPGSLTNREG